MPLSLLGCPPALVWPSVITQLASRALKALCLTHSGISLRCPMGTSAPLVVIRSCWWPLVAPPPSCAPEGGCGPGCPPPPCCCCGSWAAPCLLWWHRGCPWRSLLVLMGWRWPTGGLGEHWEAVGRRRRAGPIAVQLPHKTPCKNCVCPQI